MMTSEVAPKEAYVWIWLPGAVAPVVAGLLTSDGGRMLFNYGRNFLARNDAIALYEPELPLGAGEIAPSAGLTMPGCLRDAAPDAWGRRVVLNRRFGPNSGEADVGEVDELTYLLESGSDRIGVLDFQASATVYEARESGGADLETLMNAAERVERGLALPPDLAQAMFHGSSLGGARPKAGVTDGDRKLIAKFSASADVFNVVKGEFVAMRLAAQAGLVVAPVRLVRAAGRDVLLIERFDRSRTSEGWTRKAMVSALTLQGLDEMMARYASYEDLAEIVRRRFKAPTQNLRELFGRMVFNVLCGNTDDHARNHAAFWDGRSLSLTPAYDICPQGRAGNEASQAMLIRGRNRMSQLSVCLSAANAFLLDEAKAEQIIGGQIEAIHSSWDAICADAELTPVEQKGLWRRAFLNPFAFEGLPKRLEAWGA